MHFNFLLQAVRRKEIRIIFATGSGDPAACFVAWYF